MGTSCDVWSYCCINWRTHTGCLLIDFAAAGLLLAAVCPSDKYLYAEPVIYSVNAGSGHMQMSPLQQWHFVASTFESEKKRNKTGVCPQTSRHAVKVVSFMILSRHLQPQTAQRWSQELHLWLLLLVTHNGDNTLSLTHTQTHRKHQYYNPKSVITVPCVCVPAARWPRLHLSDTGV